jgi:hypothetical protein
VKPAYINAGSVMALVVALPIFDIEKEHLNEEVSHHVVGTGVFTATGIMAVRYPLQQLPLTLYLSLTVTNPSMLYSHVFEYLLF